MSKALTKRQIQAAETKNKILTKALLLIAKNGYDNTSIQEICNSAEVSTGAFYHHFKSKENIIIESYKQFDVKALEYSTNNLSDKSPLEKIQKIVLFQISYAKMMSLDTMRQFYRSQLTSGREFFISNQRQYPKILINYLSEAQLANVLSNKLTPEEQSRYILRLARGTIYDWCAHNGTFDMESEITISLDMLLDSMKPDTP